MASSIDPIPLIVIVGETASGKTAAGVKLAQQIDGEIICADSRTIYKGMDIGTATPTSDEQGGVAHHLLNIVEPDKRYSAAEFQKDADRLITDIWARGKFPIIVGGTGLYVDSILFGLTFGPIDTEKRHKLEAMELSGLLKLADREDIWLGGINRENRRHVARAIERGGQIKDTYSLRKNTLVLGIVLDRTTLRTRVRRRIEQMFESGLVGETETLVEHYNLADDAPHTTVYKEVKNYTNGQKSLEGVKEYLERKHMDIAKRQRTWFKRNKHIQWFDDPGRLVETAADFAASIKV